MLTDKSITADNLTKTETKVYYLNALGLQVKEIADMLQMEYETAKSHMKNIKAKFKLQKDKEVTAHFWCSIVGSDLKEAKKRIIATCLLLTLLLYIPFDQRMTRTNRLSNRARITAVARRYDYTA